MTIFNVTGLVLLLVCAVGVTYGFVTLIFWVNGEEGKDGPAIATLFMTAFISGVYLMSV